MSSRPRISRTTAIVTSSALALVAAGLLLVFVLQLSRAKGGKVQIGESQFKVPIKVTRLAGDVARAPLLFQDPLNRSLDAYLQHLGTDPRHGWQAFEAHAAAEPRTCDVTWVPASSQFRDPCSGTLYPADGTGLVHYGITIDSSDHLSVDFRSPIGTQPQTPVTS